MQVEEVVLKDSSDGRCDARMGETSRGWGSVLRGVAAGVSDRTHTWLRPQHLRQVLRAGH